ncbi:FAD-dependent oxidoreductase [Alcanivorax sp. IO_7]|nr:FAD-dependent oxidoreductase [Alcanivorax sp. IO_7]
MPGEMPAKWDEEVDVVVVGSGFAGLAAAHEAAKAGASVALLEKMRTPGQFHHQRRRDRRRRFAVAGGAGYPGFAGQPLRGHAQGRSLPEPAGTGADRGRQIGGNRAVDHRRTGRGIFRAVAHGRARGAALLQRRLRQWRRHHRAAVGPAQGDGRGAAHRHAAETAAAR